MRQALELRPVRSLIETALRQVGERSSIPFAVRFAEGGEQRTSDQPPAFTLVFRDARAYWRIAAFGHIGLLEAYFDGELDIEGNLARAMAAGMEGGMDRAKPLVRVRNWWHELRFSNASWRPARPNADFHDARREYDKVVSIGTLEHAGRDQLAQVVQAHARFLKPGGLGMLHFIGHVGHFQTEFFIRRYVFPGGWIPSLADTIVEMERAGLEVLDIENLRRHYALTLDAWGERFDRNWERIRALDPQRFNERFRRIWRVYLYGCAEAFRLPQGRLHLFQVLFSKGNVTRGSYPMGREFLYR